MLKKSMACWQTRPFQKQRTYLIRRSRVENRAMHVTNTKVSLPHTPGNQLLMDLDISLVSPAHRIPDYHAEPWYI